MLGSRLLVLAAAVALYSHTVRAADLMVFATGSMRVPLQTLATDFAKAGGDTLTFVSGTTGTVMDKVRAGVRFDVIAISAESFESLEKEGRTVPGSHKDLARALMGVAVKAGAPEPDISTPEAFK